MPARAGAGPEPVTRTEAMTAAWSASVASLGMTYVAAASGAAASAKSGRNRVRNGLRVVTALASDVRRGAVPAASAG